MPRPPTAIRPTLPRLLLALASTSLAACGESAAANGVVVDTLANGAIQVTSPESGIWTADEAWTLEPEVTIGSIMSDGPDSFARIATLAVDAAGRIYVGEGSRSEVRVFASDGSYVRTLGRDGSGPGEFRQIQGMGWGPDGNLWVVDGQNGFVVYDTVGVHQQTLPRSGNFSISPWPGRFDTRGGITDFGAMTDGRYPLIRYTNDFQQADTTRLPVIESDAFTHDLSGGGRVSYSVPFSSGLAYHVDHQGNVWTANTADYRLVRHGPAGDTALIATRPFTPIPVTAEDRDRAIEGLRSFVQQGGTVDPSRIPSSKPAFMQINSDDQGFLWVAPTVASDAERGFVNDVFDRSGRYLGQVASSDWIGLYPAPVIRGNHLIAVVQDSLDVQSVRRYRIVGRDD